MLYKRQLLIYYGYAGFFTVFNIPETDCLAVDSYASVEGAGGVNPAQNFHERRFTSAVLSDKSVYFAFPHTEGYIVKRPHTREFLHDTLHFKDVIY